MDEAVLLESTQIFLSCCDSPIQIPPKQDEPSLVLPHVCSAWRRLALHMPELWANVRVSYTDEMSVRRKTEIVEQWVARTGSDYLLNLTVDCPQPFATAAAENPDLLSGSIVPFIVANASRIRHFHISLPFVALRPILDLPSGSLKAVETAVLEPLVRLSDMIMPDSESEYCAWHWPSDSLAFDSAPLLREFSYEPAPLFKLSELELMVPNIVDLSAIDETLTRHPFFAPAFSLPRHISAQLTAVHFPWTALTSDAWCDILVECPNITSLGIAIQPSDAAPSRLLHLGLLNTLFLTAFSGHAHDLLDRLVAPRLDILTFIGTTFPVTEFLACQARSDFKLTLFFLMGFLPGEDVLHLFRNLDGITAMGTLGISTEHFPVEFWEAVGRREILPRLEFLLLRPTAVQAPALVDMIAARWDALEETRTESELTETVPNFDVQFSDLRPEHLDAVKEELKRLEKYKENGREVSIEVYF
ncbi:hypothetical protein FB45DRAFT_868367 [Roridomyces roridus]|uniref:F-box domain-containing protein n=1 Tax=Roridomyces roridus TaxID=1738132 RepID=A0AAD7FMD4_9AGAR|nr:hypothetical protein FB45DRAFT_868367 [Roridomyces roridus]